jgi:phosphohistidine swiveling domain-containing protein
LTPWAAWSTDGRPRPGSPAVDGRPLVDRVRAIVDDVAGLRREVEEAIRQPLAEIRAALASGGPAALPRAGGPASEATTVSLIARLDALGIALVARGALHSEAGFWWQDTSWLLEAARALDGDEPPPPARLRGIGPIDRWDELRFGVVRSTGTRHDGVPGASGRGVGRVRRVTGPDDTSDLEPGDVLVVEHPVPALAPFLWDRGGVVAASGSPGSHLCEVARSIHVPMVIGVAIADRPGQVIALDGDTGETWSWEP